MRNIAFNFTLLIFLMLFSMGCCVFRGSNVADISADQYMGYQPVNPTPVLQVEIVDLETNSIKKEYWKSLDANRAIRELLPLQSAQIAVSKTNSSGKITFSSAYVTGEKGSYEVIMDYMKYRVENVYDNGEFVGNGRIGIGLRVKAKVLTTKSNLNLSGLGQLGLEASKENISGGISVDIIGIDSEDVTNLIPLTSEIDQTSIQSALQALASIKSKIWEDNTIVTPHLIAVQQAKEKSGDTIRKKITSVSYAHSYYGDRIRDFWTPNGEINQNNEKELLLWMSKNGYEGKRVEIPQFLVDSAKEDLREKAVRDLNIK